MSDSNKSFRSFSTSSWGKWDFRKRKSYRSRLGFGGSVDFDDSKDDEKSTSSSTKSTSYSSGSSFWGKGGGYYDGYGSYRYDYGGGGRYSNYAWKYSSATDVEKEKKDLEFFKLAYQEARDLVNIIDFPFRVNIYMDREGKSRENKFAGGDTGAYRDIYVPGKVLASSKDDREKLTIFSGIAIHEAAHLLFTDVNVLVNEFSIPSNRVDAIDSIQFRQNHDSIVNKFLSKFVPDTSPAFNAMAELALTLTGVTEDERVEVALLEQRNGWGEYIDKQKEYYRSTYGNDIDKSVSLDKVNFRDFILALVDMIRYPDHLNLKIVDLYKDQFEKVQEILTRNLNSTYDSIFRGLQLLKICILVASNDGRNFSNLEKSFNALPDIKDRTEEEDINDEKLAEFLKEILKDKSMFALADVLQRGSRAMYNLPNASIPISGRDAGRDMSVIYRSINRSDEWGESKILDSCRGVINLGSKNNVIFYRPKGSEEDYRKIYKKVSGFTNTLRSFIQNMNKNYDFTIHGQRTGKLDTSKLAEAYQGVPQVYTKTGIVRTGGINICVVIDESGSMGGDRIRRAREAAILLNEAFGKIPGVDLFIYGQSADETNYSYEETTDIYIYREPGNRFVNPNGYALSTVSAKYENRDGVAIREIAKRIRKITSQPVLMFILSDGNPSASSYRGRGAISHTAKMVKEIKDDGFYPIQITISASCTASHEMFDTVIDLTSDLDELPKKLGGVIRKKIAEALQNNQTLVQI